MEVDARRLGQVVLEDRADAVALDDIDARARPCAVEAQGVDRILQGVDAVLDRVDGEVEHLCATVEAGIAIGLIAGAIDRPVLATEESLDHGERRGVVAVRPSSLRRGRGATVVHGGRGSRGSCCPGGGGARRARGGERGIGPRRQGRRWRARGHRDGSQATARDNGPAQEMTAAHVDGGERDRRLDGQLGDGFGASCSRHVRMLAAGSAITK